MELHDTWLLPITMPWLLPLTGWSLYRYVKEAFKHE